MNRRGFLRLLGLAPIAAAVCALFRAEPRAVVAVDRASDPSKAAIAEMRLAYTKASEGAPAPDWVYYAGDTKPFREQVLAALKPS